MDSDVPQEITTEITQILSNLVLGNNDIRQSAESAVNDRLATNPDLYLLALAKLAITADADVMRSFSLVLLRRLLFRTAPHHDPKSPRLTLYDHLSSQSLQFLERLLLYSLSHEPSNSVRRKCVDTICDVANNAMGRGRPWHALQAQAFNMSRSPLPALREAAYRIFDGCPNLVVDLEQDGVVSVLQQGLQDAASIDVRHAALEASVSYLSSSDDPPAHTLLLSMLETLPRLPPAHLPAFLSALTPLCAVHPALFTPHLPALLAFLPALVLPTADPGPTPTVARPFPSPHHAFTFPPVASSRSRSPSSSTGMTPGENGKTSLHDDPAEDDDDDEEHESRREKDDVRKAALEFMVSLSEMRQSMVRRQDGWVDVIVRGCLEGMGELPEDARTMRAWLDADPDDDPTDDSYPHVYEQALDRLACALGGKTVLPPAFKYIPSMLASYDWRLRHAGLMAVASIAEGTHKVMQNELGKVVDLVTPLFNDSNPRVRYAACQCIGQLCTDLEQVIQERYHEQIFAVLIPTLEAPEPRVHAHAAAALINFCEGVERETLLPYLDPIVERLLRLLNPTPRNSDGNGGSDAGAGAPPKPVKRYVQEQAVTTLAVVADASEMSFVKHYPSIMPLLLHILNEATGVEYRKLRVKAMECAGLIALAVGRDVFRRDAGTLAELLMRIQNSPMDPGDAMLPQFLISTWSKVCKTLGTEFEPYLPVVMPSLLVAASAKADVSLYSEDDERAEERDGWETIAMDGQLVGVRTSKMEEKCFAFETLNTYAAELGTRFAPYLAQTLEITLPSLRFHYYDGVREACATLVNHLIRCGKDSGTLTPPMLSATFLQLITCIGLETDPSFLASLYKCFAETLRIVGGPGASGLAPELYAGVVEASRRQLQNLAERRKYRAHVRQPSDGGGGGGGADAGAGGNGGDTRRRRRRLDAGSDDGDVSGENDDGDGDDNDDDDDLALLEEMEDFALEDMAQMLQEFDPKHPLLIAISSVKDLGQSRWDDGRDADSERD